MCTEYKVLLIILCVSYTWIVQGELYHPHISDVVEEIQHAVCNISTKDIQTSANASVTRQLRGVCTSKQLDIRFRQLELKILNELEIIKRTLSSEKKFNIKSSSSNNIPRFSSNYDGLSDYEELDEVKPIFSSLKSTHFKKPIQVGSSVVSPILIIDEKPTENSIISETKVDSLLLSRNEKNVISEDIIRGLNNTIQSTQNGSVFYFFWKIENFSKLMARSEMYVKSPTMLVHGHELIIQFHPNQPKEQYVTIKLKTSYSFQKKHKFEILHRRGLQKDIESPLMGTINHPNLFVVPLDSIYSNTCLKNDSIIIKLSIFLDFF